ncbi:MAG TPA: hypothetical protein VNL14_13950 [Candidatus Acidoferrales bacterium]|nr:hypothetical protein [Candidatus Acidoferrales bacterium]
MRGKKSGTELETLSRGLGSAEDPYQLKELLQRGVDDLAQEVEKRIRYTAAEMVTQGRYFMAIKEQLKHGEWEPFIQKRKWSPFYVRTCMRLLEVAARFPQALHLPPGRVTDRLLNLPMPKIETILAETPPEAVKKLTPWDLEKIYNDKKLEKSRSKPKKQKQIQAPAGLEDEKWTAFTLLYTEALTALTQLADAEIKPEWYDRIFDLEMVKKLGAVYTRLIAKMHPVEEVRKRAEVRHAPGFAG